MSHDGDGKPPNPFARAATTGAPNPFDDLMGPSSATAPNPFAPAVPAAPSPPAGAEEAPAITVLKASDPRGMPAPGGGGPSEAPYSAQSSPGPSDETPAEDPMAALGLDLAERAPPTPPAKKPVRPELEEWRSEIPHTGAGAPAEAPQTDSATRPDGRSSKSDPHIKPLAPPKKQGGALKYVVVASAIVVGVIGVGVGQRVLAAKGDSAAAPVVEEALSETDQLLRLGVRPENAPDCFTGDKGFTFSYVDSGGQTVTVSSIADVPILFRMAARCVPK